MKKRVKLKIPLYKDGMLICPHCGFPLEGVEETYFEIKCFICKQPVGKIPIATMKKMLDDTSVSLLKEWLVEMEQLSERS